MYISASLLNITALLVRLVQTITKCLGIKYRDLCFQERIYRYLLAYTTICSTLIIEGFGGKRALGFLLKSELCQKRSKFRMQFCLRVSNNVLHVFSLKFAFFLKHYVCEKTHFSEGILCRPYVE